MYTRNYIRTLINQELTPIGYHEEHGNYIDGIDDFIDRLIIDFELPMTTNNGATCPECSSNSVVQLTRSTNKCNKCHSLYSI